MLRYIYIFSTIGFAIPVVILIMGSLNIRFFYISFMFWPASLGSIVLAREVGITWRVIQVYTEMIVVNIVLYAIIGTITWLGIHKNRFILFLLVMAIGFGWYKVLMLWR